MLYPEVKITSGGCFIQDPINGVRGVPNCVTWGKKFESALIEYRMNSCGHRAGMECGPKAPGTYRIVMIGSSIGEGLRLAREQTFAALLPGELSRRSGRKVEIYNEAMEWGTPRNVDLHLQDALVAQPDLLVWPLSAWDLDYVSFTAPYSPNRDSQGRAIANEQGIWQRATTAIRQKTLANAASDAWKHWLARMNETRTAEVMMHITYLDTDLYIDRCLDQGIDADFLRATPGPVWQSHIQQLDPYIADIEARAAQAKVPILVVYVPQRAQAAMISRGRWPIGFDPYMMGNHIGPIVESHGGIFFDLSPSFRTISHPERYYYPVDGHPNAAGHKVLTLLLAAKFTSGVVPELRVVVQQKPALVDAAR